MPYRVIYVGLGLTALAAIILGIVFASEGESLELPSPLQAVSPEPGAMVPPQSVVEIDLPVGYRAEITVDGWPVDDVGFVEATGVFSWAPSPSSAVMQEWAPGEHTVAVTWDTYSGLPDPGSFEWTFRIG